MTKYSYICVIQLNFSELSVLALTWYYLTNLPIFYRNQVNVSVNQKHNTRISFPFLLLATAVQYYVSDLIDKHINFDQCEFCVVWATCISFLGAFMYCNPGISWLYTSFLDWIIPFIELSTRFFESSSWRFNPENLYTIRYFEEF